MVSASPVPCLVYRLIDRSVYVACEFKMKEWVKFRPSTLSIFVLFRAEFDQTFEQTIDPNMEKSGVQIDDRLIIKKTIHFRIFQLLNFDFIY